MPDSKWIQQVRTKDDRRSRLIIGLERLVNDSKKRGVPSHTVSLVDGIRRLLIADEAVATDD